MDCSMPGFPVLHCLLEFALTHNGNPLQCSCLENPRDRGAWWIAVYEVAQSQTRLKRLSSSSIISIESMMLSNHVILCHPLLLLPSIFPSIRVFFSDQLFTSDGWRIGASATSLSFSIQGWFPLELTGLILLFMGLLRVFSSTTHRKHGAEPLWSISHFHAAVRL